MRVLARFFCILCIVTSLCFKVECNRQLGNPVPHSHPRHYNIPPDHKSRETTIDDILIKVLPLLHTHVEGKKSRFNKELEILDAEQKEREATKKTELSLNKPTEDGDTIEEHDLELEISLHKLRIAQLDILVLLITHLVDGLNLIDSANQEELLKLLSTFSQSILKKVSDLRATAKTVGANLEVLGEDSEKKDQATVESDNHLKEHADQVEAKLTKDDKFLEEQNKVGAKLDTIVKVKNGEDDEDTDEDEEKAAEHVIDSQNNMYVLTKPRDSTAHFEDRTLLYDFAVMLCSAFICGIVAHSSNMPIFFGHVLGGIVVGPFGLDQIHGIVQLETIAQFGVFFILFVLGLEFDVKSKLRNIHTVLLGVLSILLSTMLIVALCSFAHGASTKGGILLGLCICMSSTSVILKVLNQKQMVSDFGVKMINVLVIEDLFFGIIMSILPLLATSNHSVLFVFKKFAWIALAIITFTVAAHLLVHGVAINILKRTTNDKEMFMLTIISVCLSALVGTHYLNISNEMGCFIIGCLVTYSDHTLSHTLIECITPIRDLFACLFFGTIGLHIYPSFLWNEAPYLLFITMAVIFIKFSCCYIVQTKLLRTRHDTAFIMSLGLSQVSEFGFVIASRGKHYKLITREQYYILLGIITLSLAFVTLILKYLLRTPLISSSSSSDNNNRTISDTAPSTSERSLLDSSSTETIEMHDL